MSNPTWAYRRGADGAVEARIFPDGMPDEPGWHDTPAKIDQDPQPAAPVKRGRGRPRKQG